MYIKMSRIGKKPISIPLGITLEIKNHTIIVHGPLGVLSQRISSRLQLEFKKNNQEIKLKIFTFSKEDRSLHGLYRSLIQNMFVGVTQGFTKELELVGVGYRVSIQGQRLEITLGLSHNIIMETPTEIKMETKSEKGKNSIIILKSHNKQLLGSVAAKIRSFKKPDPYQGKGIRYIGEEVRKKVGKSA
ncbi:50S ribosomal protein L6 [Candidatus Uzinura diaspidicola str. ASNER]|uniref:Large ribosomal subunit protein uL6 n=1 Tax=Candidatus Uzinura diaspidicola str. ASNER TaxID=1133592 RepID=L7VKA6_9FLAO|nr:50S ribosomal protein L6 [Candidatus Uzinura diaspidicola str. ASNER]